MEGVLRQPLSFRSCREDQTPTDVMHKFAFAVNFKRIHLRSSQQTFRATLSPNSRMIDDVSNQSYSLVIHLADNIPHNRAATFVIPTDFK